MSIKNTGFALLEVIISIVVLSGVLAGATGLIWSASTAVERNQDRLTATYLAQECMELARNTRDASWRQHLPWNCAFDEFPSPDACAILAAPLTEMKKESGENLIPLFGEPSKFSRHMTVIKNENDVAITCEVSWPRRNGTEHIFLDEVLTNWRKI